MANAEDIKWFKEQFGNEIDAALAGTPFTLDFLAAIACQETGDVWPVLRKKGLNREQVLELCVGDTIDEPGRRAFPTNKDQLLNEPHGLQMFTIARQALEEMAKHVSGYEASVRNPAKFCHAFGIFQRDLQFFSHDPDYFLQKRYALFPECLKECLEELKRGLKKLGFQDRSKLTDFELAAVGIAYNKGSFDPSKGLKQGFFNEADKKFYGEQLFDYLRLAKTVAAPGSAASLPTPVPGSAPLPPPTPVEASGPFYEVDVRESPLNLRRQPEIDQGNPRANVIASLPDGQIVQATTNQPINGFLEVETSLLGAHLRGFASAKFLKPAQGVSAIPVVTPAPTQPTTGITKVDIAHKPGEVTKRSEPANAFSLNEPDQPDRKGTTPDDLRTELARIIDWLGVDDPGHLRYQPAEDRTFCNVYAHDYCYLAGVYLPRVWWSHGAIEELARGQSVQPHLGSNVDEQRANDLFRWLRDFGPRFGWRQTGSTTKLQLEVNQGAIGIIVARRTVDGSAGHIVAVVPETEAHQAQRDSSGEVIAPLQSQAGSRNFRYGTGNAGWWNGVRFAERGFWLHA